jgi:hypothetical protein
VEDHGDSDSDKGDSRNTATEVDEKSEKVFEATLDIQGSKESV